MAFCKRPVLFGLILVTFFLPAFVSAKIGVGVGLGKIELDKPLQPGGIYELPSIPVLNTGDETGEYEVGIEYFQNQPQLLPPEEWFRFGPPLFTLEPGEVKLIKISLSLPIRTEPGDYFAFVEGRAVKKSQGGGTNIGVAAAAKLYFSVTEASGWEGLRYRAIVLWKKYSPWPLVVLAVIGVAIAGILFRRFFSLNLQIGVKEGKPNKKARRKRNE